MIPPALPSTIAQRRFQAAHLIRKVRFLELRENASYVAKEEGPLEDAHLSEAQKIRRLQVIVNMVMSVISQDPNLTIEEASELCAGTKRAALAMFPDKELAYDIIYRPRLQRLMNERFHLQ